jgi:2-polyprenyl-3-methyl-5-hydroxy-6-metoxy-1,4-benzoquinol methylase
MIDEQEQKMNDDRNKYFIDKLPSFDKMLQMPYPVRFEFFARYIKDNDRILDIGCQFGYFAYYISKKQNIRYYGIDISQVAIDDAIKNTANCTGIAEFKLGDVEDKIDYNDEQFDVVVSSQVLEHLKDPQKLLDEMFRLCKPDGVIIVSTPIMNEIMCHEHRHIFSYYSIMELFDKYASDYKIYKWNKFKQIKEKHRDIFIVVMRKGKQVFGDDNIWRKQDE